MLAVFVFPIHITLQILNLAVWAILIVGFSLFKFALPFTPIIKILNRLFTVFMWCFGQISMGLIFFFNRPKWEYELDGEINKNNWYLLISNHLSYLDIILLIEWATSHIPAPKFFLKKELIWLPFVGQAAWALDMPFMQRYSREFIEKNPHLKGKDIETTRKSCEKYRLEPTTVINFVEGTRFSEAKAKLKGAEFNHLLPPKAGGIAFTLAAMGELFSHVIDVTIVYPENPGHIMMDLLCGKLKRIVFKVKVQPVSDDLIGDYFNDDGFKNAFQERLNQHWHEKDQVITEIYQSKKQ